MNISQANDIVANLLDDESASEYLSKLPVYYDFAQKQIATTVDNIHKKFILDFDIKTQVDLKKYLETKYNTKIFKIKKIISSESYTRVYGDEYVFDKGVFEVFCDVYPQTITNDTSLDAEFEVSPEAQPAICYYAAAQCVATESDRGPYVAFIDRYNNILQNIADTRRDKASINIVKLGV